MTEDNPTKPKISARTQNEIAFGQAVLARLEAFAEQQNVEPGDRKSETEKPDSASKPDSEP